MTHGGRSAEAPADSFDSESDAAYLSESKWDIFKRGVRSWWYRHPAHVALDVASPLVGKYARAHPLKLLGAAAVLGAAVVFLKPWRLVSMGGVLLAALKSSDVTGMVLSMMTPEPHDSDI